MRRGIALFAAVLGLFAASGCDSNNVSADGPCTSNKNCTAGNVCVAGSCRPSMAPTGCTVEEDCPLGQVCDTVTGACIDPNQPLTDGGVTDPPDSGIVVGPVSCTDDTPCTPTNRHCDVRSMMCVECLVETDCIAPMKCTDGECLDPSIDMACNDDSTCAPPMIVCVGAVCVRGCGETNGLMCTGGNLCNPVSGHCENPNGCTDDMSCGAPAGVCEMGNCLPGCGQVGGISCGAGTVCDTSTGRCVVVLGPCSIDANCTPPSTVCESSQCIPGCAEPAGLQCVGMTRCNPGTGRCEMGGMFCGSDLECNNPAEICNLATGDCDPGCATTGCTAPATCNMATGHCTGVMMCASDGFEPNNTAAAAAGIATGMIPNLFGCPNDDDYYSIALGLNDSLTIDLTFVIGEGNLDLELLNSSNTVVASGHATGSNESMTYTVAAAGSYVVRVYLANDLGASPGNSYTMTVNHVAAPCMIDAFEDNDSDSSPRTMSSGSFNSLNVCPADEDFYAIQVSSGDTIDATVNFTNGEGDIDLRLINPLGFNIALSSGTGNSENIHFTTNLFGTYILRVYMFSDSGTMLGNSYSLNLSVSSAPPPMCTADQYEPNNSQAAAVSLPIGSYASLGVCSGDDDFYALALNAGDVLDATVSFTNAEGDTDITLLDSAGTVVASSAGVTDNEHFTYTVPTTATYTLHVYLYGDAGSMPGNTYGLTLTR